MSEASASSQLDMFHFPSEHEWQDGVGLFEEESFGLGEEKAAAGTTTSIDMDLDGVEDAPFFDENALTFNDEVACSERLSISSEEEEEGGGGGGGGGRGRGGSDKAKGGSGGRKHLHGGGGVMTEALQRRALRLPMQMISIRNTGDMDKLQAFFEENFASDVKVNMCDSGLQVGYAQVLKYFVNTLELYPDSVIEFKRARLAKPSELFFAAISTGTRVDSIARDLEGDEKLFASFASTCEVSTKGKPDHYLDSMVKDAGTPLSESAVSSIRQMESKVQQQDALARIVVRLYGKWTFEERNGKPIVVAAFFYRKLKKFMAVPVLR